MTRDLAGCLRFLVLTECEGRPARSGRSRCFEQALQAAGRRDEAGRGQFALLEISQEDAVYPMSFTDEIGEKIKAKPPCNNLPVDVEMTGRYVMGANELHIMRALEKVI